jgi:hypothetical protein
MPKPDHTIIKYTSVLSWFFSAVSLAAKRFEQKCEVNQEIKEVMRKVVTVLKEG